MDRDELKRLLADERALGPRIAMPPHRDMPEGWRQYAERRSQEMPQAVERAREARAANAPASLDELARRRRRRLEAQDAARADSSFPPPPPPFSAA